MNRSTTVEQASSRFADTAGLVAAGRVGGIGQHRRRGLRQVVAGLLVGDVQQRPESAGRGQQRQRGLHVDPDITGAEGGGGGVDRQLRAELVVDQQRPDVLEADAADQIVDVDAAVPQRPAVPIGFGDRGVEGDHTLQAGYEVCAVRGVVVISDDLHVEDADCGWDCGMGTGFGNCERGNCRGATRSVVERWHSRRVGRMRGGQLLATSYWDTMRTGHELLGTFYRPVIWAVPSQCLAIDPGARAKKVL